MTFKHIFLSSLLALSALGAYAVPAMPGLITMTQTDGSEIKVSLIGDEFSHYYLSEDGYLLTTVGRDFYYADVDEAGDIVNSGLQARPVAMRTEAARRFLAGVDMKRAGQILSARREQALSARQSMLKSPVLLTDESSDSTSDAEGQRPAPVPGLIPGTTFPSTGQQKALVLLVNYSDVKMSTPDTHAYFSGLLNEPGFDRNGATGSVRDYFEDCSGGKFQPEFDVYGPVDLPYTRAYYGGNDFAGNDRNAWQMITDACQILDKDVDFSQYDRNGDGYIDNVFVFYAGRGEASGGGDDTVWPHSWEIERAGMGTYEFDGVTVNRYACSNELVGISPDGVGTFIHEFSHVMGLPDLYSTNRSSAFTPGAWSVLDYGPYNNAGRTPPLYGAFERCALGWMTPREISTPLSVSLEPLFNNVAGIIRTSSENEYFLLENRQQQGWDKYIPGHGMLIWHVHYVPSVWTNNAVNNTLNHQYVDLEEADGLKSESSRAGDTFPGKSGITEFTDDTTPSMATWSGEKLDLPITAITESETGMISFDVAGGSDTEFPVTELNAATDITHSSFRVSWQPKPGFRYALSLYEKGAEFPIPAYSRILVGTVTSYEFTDLEPDTEYFCRVYVGNDWQFGSGSEPIEIKTLPVTLDMLTVNAHPATEVTPTSFVASWDAVKGATDHVLSVYTLTQPEMTEADCDFTGRSLPEGWTLSFDPTFSPNSNYSGNAFPALGFNRDGQTITSPSFGLPVASVKFWHICTKEDPSNLLALWALAGDEWVKVAEYQLSKKEGGLRGRFEDFPLGTKAVRFEFVRSTTYGQLFLDDIHVECHEPVEKIYVDGYESRPLGTETSCRVDGLTPSTTYYYMVGATDGSYVAQTSKEIEVALPGETGIVEIVAGGDVTVSGHDGYIEVTGLTAGQTVTVCDLPGRTIASEKVVSTGFRLPVVPGIYIVRVGETVAKLMMY